ncbi:MAG: WbqC family protein, partial [Muribaculaceae bacterium]|nr:WbqC family protein [Muribaculaceae bacterium]
TPEDFDSVAGLDRAVDSAVRSILGLSTEVIYASELKDGHTEAAATPISEPVTVEYYQVRKAKLGFIPGLSILDLIFNMGPEAAIVLHSMMRPVSV